MKRPLFSVPVILVAAALLLTIACRQTKAADQGFPSHVSETLKNLLNLTHTTWHSDAVLFKVELKQGVGQSWLEVGEYSPSTGATLTMEIGGPANGTFSLGNVDPSNRFRVPAAIPPDFKIDLPDAIATLRRVGFNGSLGVTVLRWGGGTGTPPMLVWSIYVAGSPIMFPVFINAQDGMIVPWRRAMDMPNGSDAQLRAAWAALQRSRQPQSTDPAPGTNTWRGCVAMIQAGYASC